MPVRAPLALDLAAFERTDASPVVEVVVTWARTILDVRHLAAGAYTIGESRRASFPLHAPRLPRASVPLVRWRDGAPELCFTRDTAGELVHAADRTPLRAHLDPQVLDPSAVHVVPLAPGTTAHVHHGAVTFTVRRVPAARNLARLAGIDWTPSRHITAAAGLIALLLAAAFHTRPPGRAVDLDIVPDEPRFLGYRVGGPQTATDPGGLPGARDGEPPHRGESGRLGDPRSRGRGHYTLARRAAPQRLTLHFDPDSADPIARTILGLHTAEPGSFFPSPYSLAERPSLHDERDLWAGRSPRPRPAYGVGGLGGHDTGRGAGGLHLRDDLFGLRGGALPPTREDTTRVATLRPLSLGDARRALARRPLERCGSPGAASVHFTVDGTGRVRDLDVRADPTDRRAATCIADHIRRTRFPRRLGTTRLVYPLPAPLAQFPAAWSP